MKIPKVAQEQIIEAFKTFDRDYRNSHEWIGWETKKSQKYVIKHEGRLYPPKMIISLATGLPRTEFNGGQQSIRYLAKYGIKVEPISGHFSEQTTQVNSVSIRKTKGKQPMTIQVKGEYNCCHELVLEMYKLLKKLPRYNRFSDMKQMPDNGIYFFFEVGESNPDGFDRIVRIGTHRSDGRLRKRIRQHYRGNRNSSVFRKHLGGAIVNRECPDSARLENWINKDKDVAAGLENRVSEILEQNFYFTCIEVEQAKERLELEEGLIALFSGDKLEQASDEWLGNDAVSKQIRKSGLWNSEHTEGSALTEKQLARLGRLVERSLMTNSTQNGPKALVLIPCCKSKTAVLSDYWSPPLHNLQQARTGLLEKIDLTESLSDKDSNLRGILNPYSHVTRALDLYVGNFYYAAGNALEHLSSGGIAGVDLLIVSGFYGLLLPNEGIKRYELQMSDTLEDGTKVYRYWQSNGLARTLSDYVVDRGVTDVWSLLPNSMPSFPYQQVFNAFWKEAKAMGVNCYHVNVPGAGSSTGYQRARWLQSVLDYNPEMLLNDIQMPSQFKKIPGYEFKYVSC